jgi:hypothetical protein
MLSVLAARGNPCSHSTSYNLPACSLGLSATSQQYFSLRTNQPSSNNIFLSEQSTPATNHQPNERFLAEQAEISSLHSFFFQTRIMPVHCYGHTNFMYKHQTLFHKNMLQAKKHKVFFFMIKRMHYVSARF